MRNKIMLSLIVWVGIASAALAAKFSPGDLQKNFNVTKGGRLVVSVSAGDISVKVWDKMEVEMTARNIGDEADHVVAEQDGNTVKVEYHSKWGWSNANRDLRFEFRVPKEFNVDLKTSGGDIGVSGALAGDASVQTSGGDLVLDGISGKVEGKTSGGDITVKDIEGAATLSTSGGDIHIGHAAKDLQISTSGGDINVGTVDSSLRATTSGGDIQISKVGGNLNAFTSSGNITAGNVGGNVTISTSGGDITLSSGKGRVKASTSGGDVDVRGVVGSAKISSSGGTVKVDLTPKGDEASSIESSGGDVYLYIPPDAKATIRAEVSGDEDSKVVSDFPVAYKSSGEGDRQRAECLLNGGGQEIYLHTSGGNVYLKNGSGPTGK